MKHSRALETGDDFGPAMRKLTAQEQLFVCVLFSSPKSITQAARDAGYTSETPLGLRLKAHRLLRKPEVADAVREESKRRTTFLAPKAQMALANLLDHSEHADHFKAIKMVRDDAGVSQAVAKVLNVNVTVTQQEKIEAIKRFALAHPGFYGPDVTKLLGLEKPSQEAVLDAEFTEDVTDISELL